MVLKLQSGCPHPYTWPATLHFLKSIMFSVSVPVLSEKMYFTCKERESTRGGTLTLPLPDLESAHLPQFLIEVGVPGQGRGVGPGIIHVPVLGGGMEHSP